MIEYGILALMIIAILAIMAVGFQVRAIVREVRADGRTSRDQLAHGLARVDTLEQAIIQAMREQMQGQRSEAVETLREAETLPKPHRPIWRFSSEEKTNGEHIVFYTCAMGGCRDVLRVGPDDPPAEDGG